MAEPTAARGEATLGSVRERLGGGSSSDINAALKELMEEVRQIPASVQPVLEPVMAAAAKSVHEAMMLAADESGDRHEALQPDNDGLSNALAESEALNAELKEPTGELVKRGPVISLAERKFAKLEETVKPADAEVVKRTIREEDRMRAKAEAGEDTKRAARLRRQLVESRNANVNREGERVNKELTAAAKWSGSRVLGPLSRPAGAGNLTTSLDAGQAARVPARFSSRR